jgi:hypothetical protein
VAQLFLLRAQPAVQTTLAALQKAQSDVFAEVRVFSFFLNVLCFSCTLLSTVRQDVSAEHMRRLQAGVLDALGPLSAPFLDGLRTCSWPGRAQVCASHRLR